MNKNRAFLSLNDPLPADIARRKEIGDLAGALALIDRRLAEGGQPLLAPRLEVERLRLNRLRQDYPYSREAALAALRAEWPRCTQAQFDRLVDGGRIDWRMIDGALHCHERFLESLRLYPGEASGLKRENPDHTHRDRVLARMEAQGALTARITVRATIQALVPVEGQEVQAWLPIPAACPQQSQICILDHTPGGVAAPEEAPQRTMWWRTAGTDRFTVTYRYLFHARYADPMDLPLDPVQPAFDLEEQAPHIVFTPYLRALAAELCRGCSTPAERARAIYDYVTGQVDYRYQPAYLQLDCIADQCAKTLRGDCGWLWADCSYGSSARRCGETARRRHYFGSLDPWRMVANSAFQAPLTPPMTDWRQDPYDNQVGELMVGGRGLAPWEREAEQELVDFTLLEPEQP